MSPEEVALLSEEDRALLRATDAVLAEFLARHPGRVTPEVASVLGELVLLGPGLSVESLGPYLDRLLAAVTATVVPS
jgi:hypothetical protein